MESYFLSHNKMSFLVIFRCVHQQSPSHTHTHTKSFKDSASCTTGPISWFSALQAIFHALYAMRSIVVEIRNSQ